MVERGFVEPRIRVRFSLTTYFEVLLGMYRPLLKDTENKNALFVYRLGRRPFTA